MLANLQEQRISISPAAVAALSQLSALTTLAFIECELDFEAVCQLPCALAQLPHFQELHLPTYLYQIAQRMSVADQVRYFGAMLEGLVGVKSLRTLQLPEFVDARVQKVAVGILGRATQLTDLRFYPPYLGFQSSV